jgi:hypothetical protein
MISPHRRFTPTGKIDQAQIGQASIRSVNYFPKAVRLMPIHGTRDASRDIKLECQDHHPAAIAPRPPPSDPQPIGRGARLPPRLRRRSRRRLCDTAARLIGAVDRNNGLTRFKHWRDNLPSSLDIRATADALDAVLDLRGYVEELQAVDLPKGFGLD